MLDKPYLEPELEPLWQAFQQLSKSRTIGWVVEAIKPQEVLAWLDIHGWDELDERIEFYDLITALDNTWIEKNRAPHGHHSTSD